MATEIIELDTILISLSTSLQQLKCPLRNNGEDWWINELFLLPGVHRLQLYDWIFKKLGFDMEAELNDQCKEAKAYVQVFCAMGLCEKNDLSLVEGTTTKQKQLKFWKRLFDLLCLANQLAPEPCMNDLLYNESSSTESHVDTHSVKSSHESQIDAHQSRESQSSEQTSQEKNESESSALLERSKRLESEYLKSTSIIANIACNVNMNDLFVEKILVFPPDVEKDVDHILSTNKSQVEKLPDLKNEEIEQSDISNDSFSLINSNDPSPTLLSKEISAADCEKATAVSEFQAIEKEFVDVYNELKPVLRSSEKSFSNVGSKFEEVHPQMQSFSKLMSALNGMKSASLALEQESSILQDFEVNDLDLTGSQLENYISVLQEKTK